MKFFCTTLKSGSEYNVTVAFTPTELIFVRGIPFQDAAKAGLQFGDEGELER
jgi:hypothetical protein